MSSLCNAIDALAALYEKHYIEDWLIMDAKHLVKQHIRQVEWCKAAGLWMVFVFVKRTTSSSHHSSRKTPAAKVLCHRRAFVHGAARVSLAL